jgi:hypothetical protein
MLFIDFLLFNFIFRRYQMSIEEISTIEIDRVSGGTVVVPDPKAPAAPIQPINPRWDRWPPFPGFYPIKPPVFPPLIM